MKKIIIAFYVFFIFFKINAQTLAPTDNHNWVKTTTFYSQTDPIVSVNYYDELMRLQQTITANVSPDGKDVLQYYDLTVGNKPLRSYLPYNRGTNDLSYVAPNVAIAAQLAFYNGSSTHASTAKPFFDTEIEHWLSGAEVIEQGAIGETWQIDNAASDRHTKTQNSTYTCMPVYFSQSGDDWYKTVPSTACNNVSALQTTYDENGSRTDVYSHLRVNYKLTVQYQNNTTPTYTAYEYDVQNRLIAIIPPAAINRTSNITYNTGDTLARIMATETYYYKYDASGNMIISHVPGQQEIFYVYDYYNRLIMQQDGNLRAQGKWMFYRYDRQNRMVMTGLCSRAEKTQAAMQSVVNSFAWIYYSINYYYETRSTSAPFYNNTPSGLFSSPEILQSIVYEDYDLNADGTPDYVYQPYSTAIDADYNAYPKNLPTVVRTKIDATGDNWITTVLFYDRQGRPIQQRQTTSLQTTATNKTILTNTQNVWMLYNFGGDVVTQKVQNTLQSAVTISGTTTTSTIDNATTVEDNMSYDRVGRLLTVKRSVNAGTPFIVQKLSYDDLGQVISVGVHSTDLGTTFAQTIDYTYSIRGWLTSINKPYNLGTDLWGMQLQYNKNTNNIANWTPRYDGSISAQTWNSSTAQSTTGKRNYTYSYDGKNQLISAIYSQATAQTGNHASLFSEAFSYNVDGSLNSLTRYNQTSLIDNISNTYNRERLLRRMADASGSTKGAVDVTTAANILEYEYDANGNTIKDLNKGISSMSYNISNQLKQIVSPTGTVDYVYTYDGTKLARRVSSTAEYYFGAFAYTESNGSFAATYILTAQGRINRANSGFVHEYKLVDHLGNTRLMFDASGKVLQEADYYAFGLQHERPTNTANDNRFLFGDKQLESNGMVYDFEARPYDPALGRFLGADALANNYASANPYNYCLNDPINNTDPTGMYTRSNSYDYGFWDNQDPTDYEGRNRANDQQEANYCYTAQDQLNSISNRMYAQQSNFRTEMQINRGEISPALRNVLGSDLQQLGTSWAGSGGLMAFKGFYTIKNGGGVGLPDDNNWAGVNSRAATGYSKTLIDGADMTGYVSTAMIAGTVAFAGVIEAVWALAASKVAPLIPVAVRAGLAADDGDVEGAEMKSFDDIAANPKALWGKSKDEVKKILGEGWKEGTYGSNGKGWKLLNGQKSVFHNASSSAHGGAQYWGFSSGVLGKNKIVDPSTYLPRLGDKANIISK